MDYEKAYKEALERAKNIKSKILQSHLSTESCKAVSEYIDEIIPELCESEDERIRKKLYHTVLGTPNDSTWFDGTSKEAMLAWLEKQKEQKHPNGCFTCDEYKKGYEEGRRNGFTAGYNKAMKEVEQKEQKPAEWSEEDETRLTNIIIMFKEYAIRYYSKDDVNKSVAWLKSLRPDSYKNCNSRWKPSEEQMKALEIAFRKDGEDDYRSTINSLYNDLKKL